MVFLGLSRLPRKTTREELRLPADSQHQPSSEYTSFQMILAPRLLVCYGGARHHRIKVSHSHCPLLESWPSESVNMTDYCLVPLNDFFVSLNALLLDFYLVICILPTPAFFLFQSFIPTFLSQFVSVSLYDTENWVLPYDPLSKSLK